MKFYFGGTSGIYISCLAEYLVGKKFTSIDQTKGDGENRGIRKRSCNEVRHAKIIDSEMKSEEEKCIIGTAAASLQSCPTLQPHGLQPTRLLRPWDSPGKSTHTYYIVFPKLKKKKKKNSLYFV